MTLYNGGGLCPFFSTHRHTPPHCLAALPFRRLVIFAFRRLVIFI
ncbi:hypothetical protein A2U01_0069398, partial [Trifolium medium]|nr:hypothetical protein [Trifolium medium]